jgi:hypothetical protein
MLLCVLPVASPLHAQKLKDALKQHVREGIEKSDEKANRKSKPKGKAATVPTKAPPEPEPIVEPAPAPAPEPAAAPVTEPPPEPPAPASAATPQDTGSPAAPVAAPRVAPAPAEPPADIGIAWSSDDKTVPAVEPKPTGPKLPIRILGKYLKLDLNLGAGYRGWYPQQYDVVDVDVASYATWNIDLTAKLFGFLSLRRGYYESNGVSAPRTDEASVAAKTAEFAPKAVWLLGVLGVPINKVWEPQLRYESRAFETRARPSQPVCVVERKAPEDFDLATCKTTTQPLKIISTFETFVAGVRYDKSKSGSPVLQATGSKFPPLFFGVGVMQYRKPYQLDIGGYTYNQALFDGRFRGIGAALGADIGGGIDHFFSDLDAQLGLGEVSLTDKLTINELVPKGKTIGYIQGTASLGYRLALIHAAPTLILVPVIKAGGASFFLVDTSVDETKDKKSTSPSVNWDFLWTAQVSLLLPL